MPRRGVGQRLGNGQLEQLAIADRPGSPPMALPCGREGKGRPAQLMGGTGDSCIGATGSAMEQPMDRPAAAACEELSGNPLVGPGQITAAAGCDHKGASKTWTWPR